ncbi:epidermal growth factor-like protein 6 [Emydura macquarii macquarii]|uniref:epidermal growth factor-like protein 6 n=1 Tax=Emydura macquarii macquarii TaxID=1129001 RepID=UPI00352B3B9A
MGPVACSALLAALLPFLARGSADTAASSRGFRQLMTVSQPGICLYGSKIECCYGWKKNKGHCEATCEHGCKYGECVGPNKCKCFPGFTGKTCSQDTNECGLKPRPCEHRCMNTHGSYKCYCLNGYMLMPDGTCANSRTCAMVNCQYGCEEVKEEVRCLCPSTGLQLGPNGRTCIDIDECSTGKAICSYNRRCVNTFGSYYCKCQIGYELKYVRGHYDCVDINECAASTHKCNVHAECLNTQGSFKCKCKQGYRRSGFECSVIPEKSVKEVTRIPGTIKDTIKKLLAHKSSVKKHEEIKNVIPEPATTPASKVHLPSFDYEDSVYIGRTYKEETEDAVEEEEEEAEEQEDLENQIGHEQSLRGDVFIPKVKEAAAFGPVLAQRKVPSSKPEQEGTNFSVDCSFSQGICNWKQDTDDDFDWNPADRENGDGYYMTVPAFVGHKKNVGRLKLLLTGLEPKGSYCLIFNYRLAGERVGKLRVFLGSHRSVPAWEQSRGKDERWRTGKIEMLQGEETTKNIIFESERGKGKTGEIGVDTVKLVSGLCPEDQLIKDI